MWNCGDVCWPLWIDVNNQLSFVDSRLMFKEDNRVRAAREWRSRESKIPSTKIEDQFSRHCVRSLLVPDPKLVNCIETVSFG
ncbi:hypothetical protein T08_6977 [Trichinella sp. T8]|nr:hypothetical protein T08_6977 [Trichinella sp. T8]